MTAQRSLPMAAPPPLKNPCPQCPWRTSNQGKRHFGHFYTKVNLRRLWNQIRKGGGMQSCHLTDPQHPDHIAAGCKEDSVARECPGSVILVLREVAKMANEKNVVDTPGMEAYQKSRKKYGLTKSGLRYWLIERIQMGGVAFFGGPKLPEVNVDDAEIGLPEDLREG